MQRLWEEILTPIHFECSWKGNFFSIKLLGVRNRFDLLENPSLIFGRTKISNKYFKNTSLKKWSINLAIKLSHISPNDENLMKINPFDSFIHVNRFIQVIKYSNVRCVGKPSMCIVTWQSIWLSIVRISRLHVRFATRVTVVQRFWVNTWNHIRWAVALIRCQKP